MIRKWYPRLVEMLGDQGIHRHVRWGIAKVIVKLDDKEVVRLVKMLNDEEIDRGVRYSIAIAIGKLGDKEVVPRLVKMLE